MPPLFSMQEILFSWPDELGDTPKTPHLKAAYFYRLQKFQASEKLLLANLVLTPECPNNLLILSLLRLRLFQRSSFLEIEKVLITQSALSAEWLIFLRVQFLLQSGGINDIRNLGESIWKYRCNFFPLRLAYIAYLLHQNLVQLASNEI